eukprot:3068622-Rhodomonas_salina.1
MAFALHAMLRAATPSSHPPDASNANAPAAGDPKAVCDVSFSSLQRSQRSQRSQRFQRQCFCRWRSEGCLR